MMKEKLRQYGPLVLAVLVLWIILFWIIDSALTRTNGVWVYALDDAYIHTAMARNLAEHGVWGVTPHGFTSSSSSLLWTLLLAAFYYLFGVNDIVPLLLNFFWATLVIVGLYYMLKPFLSGFWQQVVGLIGFIVLIPLPYLVVGGLEHVMQILMDLFYIYVAAKVIETASAAHKDDVSKNVSWKKGRTGIIYGLAGLSGLVVMTRFEGLFLIAAVSFLLVIHKEYLLALVNGCVGVLPVVVYGMISVSKGWYFLPNSVLLKGRKPDISSISGIVSFIYSGLRQLLYNFHLFILVAAVIVILWVIRQRKNGEGTYVSFLENISFIYIVVVMMQVLFGQSGYFLSRYPFLRYDAYVTALGLLVVGIGLGVWWREKEKTAVSQDWRDRVFGRILAGLIFGLFLLPLAERGVRADGNAEKAIANIYEQQYQMGLFLQKYYREEVVAVNDIGAVCYLGEVKCLDVWGLVSREVSDLKLDGVYSEETIGEVVRKSGAKIAVVYEYFVGMAGYSGVRPKGWIEAGRWRIPDNVVCAGDTVVFYALEPAALPALRKNLAEFAAQLPSQVIR